MWFQIETRDPFPKLNLEKYSIFCHSFEILIQGLLNDRFLFACMPTIFTSFLQRAWVHTKTSNPILQGGLYYYVSMLQFPRPLSIFSFDTKLHLTRWVDFPFITLPKEGSHFSFNGQTPEKASWAHVVNGNIRWSWTTKSCSSPSW